MGLRVVFIVLFIVGASSAQATSLPQSCKDALRQELTYNADYRSMPFSQDARTYFRELKAEHEYLQKIAQQEAVASYQNALNESREHILKLAALGFEASRSYVKFANKVKDLLLSGEVDYVGNPTPRPYHSSFQRGALVRTAEPNPIRGMRPSISDISIPLPPSQTLNVDSALKQLQKILKEASELHRFFSELKTFLKETQNLSLTGSIAQFAVTFSSPSFVTAMSLWPPELPTIIPTQHTESSSSREFLSLNQLAVALEAEIYDLARLSPSAKLLSRLAEYEALCLDTIRNVSNYRTMAARVLQRQEDGLPFAPRNLNYTQALILWHAADQLKTVTQALYERVIALRAERDPKRLQAGVMGLQAMLQLNPFASEHHLPRSFSLLAVHQEYVVGFARAWEQAEQDSVPWVETASSRASTIAQTILQMRIDKQWRFLTSARLLILPVSYEDGFQIEIFHEGDGIMLTDHAHPEGEPLILSSLDPSSSLSVIDQNARTKTLQPEHFSHLHHNDSAREFLTAALRQRVFSFSPATHTPHKPRTVN